MKKQELHIPFTEAGNMLTFSYHTYPEQGGENGYTRVVWRDNTPFEATLRLDSFQRGRSAAHFKLLDPQGHEYTIFSKFLLDALQKGECLRGHIKGRWCFAKRGANYSIQLLS